MQLRQLTRLCRIDLETRASPTSTRHRRARARSSPTTALLREVIKDELLAVKEEFADAAAAPDHARLAATMSIEDLVDDKELVVMTEAQGVRQGGAGRRRSRTQGRGGRGVAGAKLKDRRPRAPRDLPTTAHAYLLFFSNLGRVYRLRALEIPTKRAHGQGHRRSSTCCRCSPARRSRRSSTPATSPASRFLFFATPQGTVKKTAFDDYDSAAARRRSSPSTCATATSWCKVIPTSGSDDIFMVSRKGMTIRFNEDDVRPMGRAAAGVRGMKLQAGDEVVSVDVARDDTAILMVTEAGYGKRTQLEHYNGQGRGGQGVHRHQAHRPQGRRSWPRSWSASTTRSSWSPRAGTLDPHGGARDLVAGPRRHRCAGQRASTRRLRGRRRAGAPERRIQLAGSAGSGLGRLALRGPPTELTLEVPRWLIPFVAARQAVSNT